MDDAKKVRLLLLMVLFLSAVCSVCLALATYTHITGELPFDLEAHYKFRDETYAAKEKVIQAAELPIRENSIDEVTLRKLHAEMIEKEKDLNAKEERLKETEALVDTILANADTLKSDTMKVLAELKETKEQNKKDFKRMSDDLEAQKKKFEEEMKFVDTSIVRKVAQTLESMQPLTSMIMLNDLDIKESARLLNAMDKDKRAKILSQMIEVQEVSGMKLSIKDRINFRKRANDIIKELRVLKEAPTPQKEENE
ncbi:MAG: hypothetical protein MK132_05970 [Lentisphaerales bacterium]|nr:hypothetical protein [Lentisphaerales bacterium]